MLDRKAQIVIGIGVIILSAAFLLVGVYFANLQGLFFQNGARSLQIFTDNIGSSINSLYSAPSSMTITLNGNNSLCSWDPAISAYTCAGGSKIYNISYANGPTLDSGKNVFSMALCFMVGYGFGGAGGSEETSAASDAVDAEEGISQAISNELAGEQATLEDAAKTGEQAGQAGGSVGEEEGDNPSLVSRIKQTIKSRIKNDLAHPFIQPLAEDSLLSSSLSTIQDALPKLSTLIPVAVASMSAALLVVPVVELWFGASGRNINTYITKGVYADGIQVGALTGPSVSISQQIAAAYLNQEPLPFKYAAANLVLQQYSQTLSSAQTLNSLPAGLGKDALILFASKQAAVNQNVLSELSAAASATPSNSYSTPKGGVEVPGNLSSPNSLIGLVSLSPSGQDPLLTLPFFLAQNAFLVYARTASCLSVPSQPLNPANYNSAGKAFSSAVSEFGAITTLIDAYNKVNAVLPLGTYFVGYGGEVYLNGQSSGRPTQVTDPIITDMNDMCELAETASIPGQNLNTIIQPSGNGSISFSVSQGLYNTLCSENNPLFPNTLQKNINSVLNSKSLESNMTILLPPGDALAISNRGNSVDLCVYNMLIDSFGSPVISTSQVSSTSNITEFGSPISCVNLTNLTSRDVNFGITNSEMKELNNNMISSNDFYINNNSLVGFSVPLTDFPNVITAGSGSSSSFLSAGNFISGGKMKLKNEIGITFPVASFVASLFGKKLPNLLHTSVGTSLTALLISPLNAISSYNTNLSYYETDYANVTLQLTKTTRNGVIYYDINKVYNNLVFGVYPNNPNSLGGTYISG